MIHLELSDVIAQLNCIVYTPKEIHLLQPLTHISHREGH